VLENEPCACIFEDEISMSDVSNDWLSDGWVIAAGWECYGEAEKEG
jgi:hypothetical protein